MLSIVDAWGCIQHFFKSCLATANCHRLKWHTTGGLECWPASDARENSRGTLGQETLRYPVVRSRLQLLQPAHLRETCNANSNTKRIHPRRVVQSGRQYRRGRKIRQDADGRSLPPSTTATDSHLCQCSLLLRSSKPHHHVSRVASFDKR
jgi:hypothetical protein